MVGVPWLLYCLRNNSVLQSRSHYSELKPGAKRGKSLTLLQCGVVWGRPSQPGSLGRSCIRKGEGAITSSQEPNTIVYSLGCWCSPEVCASSFLAQPRHNFTLGSWGTYSCVEGCRWLPLSFCSARRGCCSNTSWVPQVGKISEQKIPSKLSCLEASLLSPSSQ